MEHLNYYSLFISTISLKTIFLSALTVVSIYSFYRFFESKWPENYFSNDDKTSIFISVSPMRFLLFRMLPVAIIISLIFAIEKNIPTKERILWGIFIAFVHAILSNGVSLFKILTKNNSVKIYINRLLQIGTNVLTILIVICGGAIGGLLSGIIIFQKLTPTFQGIIDNLWSSFIAIAAFFTFKKIYQLANNKTKTINIYEKSYEKIGAELLNFIKEKSKENYADFELVLAVCMIENIQRPKWFRELEKLAWTIFRKGGTYGIMQIKSSAYISDKESISIAIDKYFKNTKNMIVNFESLKKYVSTYNNLEKYTYEVFGAYCYLRPLPIA